MASMDCYLTMSCLCAMIILLCLAGCITGTTKLAVSVSKFVGLITMPRHLLIACRQSSITVLLSTYLLAVDSDDP